MKTPKWICKECKQPLTRKWNAKRHCNTKHNGMFESIISFSEYLMTTKLAQIQTEIFIHIMLMNYHIQNTYFFKINRQILVFIHTSGQTKII